MTIKCADICRPLLTSSEMSRLDSLTIEEKSYTTARLIQDAASSLFESILSFVHHPKKILILCGGGNNGGDGYALALLFANSDCDVFVCNLAERISSAEAKHYRDFALAHAHIEELSYDRISEVEPRCDIIIDAVYGTGFRGSLPRKVIDVFSSIKTSTAVKISVDLPSGTYCDTAQIAEGTFFADLTLTFEFLKPCHVSYPAKANCGEVTVLSIGFSERTRSDAVYKGILLGKNITDRLNTAPSPESHKGDFGKILSVCGSSEMTGAAILSTIAALRSGVGLFYLACGEDCMRTMQQLLIEPIFLPYGTNFEKSIGDLDRFDVVLHGCGSGQKRPDITRHLIEHTKSTLILDADAINNISSQPSILLNRRSQTILTPHPLEMARLCNCGVDEVQHNRIGVALDFADRHRCIIVLKGAATVIAAPDGRYAVNQTGNPGMAKGGSGDILAGMIASYCIKSDDIFTDCCAAVYNHGLAGDRCLTKMSRRSMLPSDMLEELKTL